MVTGMSTVMVRGAVMPGTKLAVASLVSGRIPRQLM